MRLAGLGKDMGHKLSGLGRRGQKRAHKKNKRIVGDRIRWPPVEYNQGSYGKTSKNCNDMNH